MRLRLRLGLDLRLGLRLGLCVLRRRKLGRWLGREELGL